MIDQARLAECVGRLDAGTRALLDLSLRRAIPDDQVASVLGVDAASIPPRRARGIAELADMMEVPGPSELAALLIAIPELPESAWGVPVAPPFSGQVSRARRARAFRRTAVAASPLVALGAVIAAIAVSAGSDNGGSGKAASGRAGAGAAGQAASGPQASISSPAPRHGLPAGVPLTPARAGKAKHSHAERAAARRHRARHHEAVAAQQAIAPRERSSAPRTERVVFHPPAPAPVVHTHPRHVTRHHAPAAPKPVPAPHASPPSTPVSSPAPAPVQQPSSTVQVSAPATQVVSSPPSSSPKPLKPSVPPVSVQSPGGGEDEGNHGCGDDGDGFPGRGHHYGRAAAGTRPFTPPGLFKKRSGLRH